MDNSVSDLVLFIGRFHPIIVHFPIGFLFFAFILEAVSRLKKYSHISDAIPLALLAGAISAFVACIMGYMLSQSGDYEKSTLDTHFWFGIATTALAFLAWLIRTEIIRIQSLAGLKPNISVLLLVILVLGITGHYGGNLTHGSDYLLKYAPFGNDEKIPLVAVTNVKEAGVYDYLVNPIFETKCISCHNKSKKKGGLSLQDSVAIKKGGENGAAIAAGDVNKSELMRRVMLDPHHEDFMPPEGKTPLTDEEMAILNYWIDKGNADFNINLGELETSEYIVSLASKLLGLKDTSGRVNGDLPIVSKVNKEVLESIVEEGFRVRELVFESNLYEIVLPPQTITKDNAIEIGRKLKKLLPIKENIMWLSLKDNYLGDQYLKDIGTMVNLYKLDIDNNPISDIGVAELANIPNLEGLNLFRTKVTKKSLSSFSRMISLKRVYVSETLISKNDVALYMEREERPNLVIGI